MSYDQKIKHLKGLTTKLEDSAGMGDKNERNAKMDEIALHLLTVEGLSTLDILKFVAEAYTFGAGEIFAETLLAKMMSNQNSSRYWETDIIWLTEVVKKKEKRAAIEYLTTLIRSNPEYSEETRDLPHPKSMTT